ncbi:FecR family protein [Mucilaginibacter gracilis]|uniref:FecR family protein n=1 Tax=Mucilaginibacter gracilis TaxID=423350 RepID=A0A495IZJ3_9SPHI|nr:FecR domain-containing protein [Mucilaginibacter gracilis]RKR82136.1 FecR family protein [Mucilaginibacter gracilis]
MDRRKFLELFEKQQQRTITPAEEQLLEKWFDGLQKTGLSDWDQQAVGDHAQLEAEIYNAVITRENNKVRRMAYPYWYGIAASLLLICSIAFFSIRNAKHTPSAPIAYQTSRTAYGEVKKIALPDGSEIWLNAGSSIRYPQTFGRTREIILNGEAFFEVVHDKDRPFIVHAGTLNTQVLGTSFNIKAYPDDAGAVVAVATGKVGVYHKGGATEFLTPGQAVNYEKHTGRIAKISTSIADATAWKTGRLVYRNVLLSEALLDLYHKYGVKVGVAASMRHCRIYGTFEHDRLEKLLEMLSYSVNGKVIKTESGYEIRGKGCN